MRMQARFIEFDGDVQDLSRELFGVGAHVLLGGSPLACTVPQEAAVVDVSLPTFFGANIARFKPLAVIEHLARSLDDSSTKLFAVWCSDAGIGFADDDLFTLMDAAHVRICRENDNAATIAHYLACHPHVLDVFYPGLKSDRCFSFAAQVLAHGFGNAIEFRSDGAAEARPIHAAVGDVFNQIEALERILKGT